MTSKIKQQLFDIVFEADTKKGKLFDVAILVIICLSVAVVILESVPDYRIKFGELFIILEWTFTIIFLIEYILRIAISENRTAYVFSFFGIIDLLSILPAFIAIFFVGAHSLIIIRSIRLLRIFRILKISRYTSAGLTLKKPF